MLDIRVDDLDPIAESTFSSHFYDLYDAHADWQRLNASWHDLSVNPRTCLRENKPRLCTYNAWFARPVSIPCKTLFRLAMSNRCVHAILRFRMGCHNLPQDVGQ